MTAAAFTIVGAGPVGALMAWLLARRGVRVQLFERRADPRTAPLPQDRSINLALAARGLRALQHAELLERVSAHLVPMRGRMLHDGRGELRFLPYSRNAGEQIYSIGRERLNRLLIDAIAAHPQIAVHFQTRCVDVDALGGTLTLEDRHGQRRSVPFQTLLAADGAGSAARQALVRGGATGQQEQDLEHDYKELMIGPSMVAGQRRYAFEPQALHIWPRGGYMLIALPNPDESFTATLFLPRHGDPSFERLADAASVREFFTDRFPDAAAAIADLDEQFRNHPQGRLGTVYCDRWQVGGRVLLLGDAAHAIVPFHGQGLNCGWEDCRILDELLAGGVVAPALEQFEQLRRPDAAAIAAMALENYAEMREAVRSPQFAVRQALGAELERQFPGRFVPRYSMVMFHDEISYSEAQRRGLQQERVLDELMAVYGVRPLDERGLSRARQLLDEQGL